MLSDAKRADLVVWLMGFLMRNGTERPKSPDRGRGWSFTGLGITLHSEQRDETDLSRHWIVVAGRWRGEFLITQQGICNLSITDEESFMRDIAALRLVD